MKNLVSYMFPVVLLISIIVLGCMKIIYHDSLWITMPLNFDSVIIVLYILWIMYELKVSHSDVTQEKVVSDYGTREIYGVSHGLTILSALWFDPIWRAPGIYHCIGFIFFVSGMAFRIWAVTTLGKYYSHMVRKLDHHKIIDTGPYRFLRHPAYTGMIIAHIGIAIFYFNYITVMILVLLLIPSIIVRIIIEERTLFSIEGYSDYSKNRKRIVPLVW